jgi:hypothetical protein
VNIDLDADQQLVLELWQKQRSTRTEPLWCGDGKDQEFDALANKIFEDFANKEEIKEEIKEEYDTDDDMPELITCPEDLQYIISNLEQQLANAISLDYNSGCCSNVEANMAYIVAVARLAQLDEIKKFIKEYIMFISLDEKRDRLEYLLDGNKYYHLITELNEYEQDVITEYFNDFANQLDMELLESNIDLSADQNQEHYP